MLTKPGTNVRLDKLFVLPKPRSTNPNRGTDDWDGKGADAWGQMSAHPVVLSYAKSNEKGYC